MHDPTACSKIVEHLLHIQVDYPELEKKYPVEEIADLTGLTVKSQHCNSRL